MSDTWQETAIQHGYHPDMIKFMEDKINEQTSEVDGWTSDNPWPEDYESEDQEDWTEECTGDSTERIRFLNGHFGTNSDLP